MLDLIFQYPISTVVLTLIIAYFLNLILNFGDSRAPPTIGKYVPYLGCIYQYATDPVGLFRNAYKEYGNVFTLYLFGKKKNGYAL